MQMTELVGIADHPDGVNPLPVMFEGNHLVDCPSHSKDEARVAVDAYVFDRHIVDVPAGEVVEETANPFRADDRIAGRFSQCTAVREQHNIRREVGEYL